MGANIYGQGSWLASLLRMVPSENWEFATKESSATLADRLHSHVQPHWFFAWPLHRKRFAGWVTDDRFHLVPAVRASTAPRIEGRFISAAGGTLVSVRLQMHPRMVALIAIVSLAIAAQLLTSGFATFWWRAAMALAIPICVAGCAWLDFYFAVPYIKTTLAECLQVPRELAEDGQPCREPRTTS